MAGTMSAGLAGVQESCAPNSGNGLYYRVGVKRIQKAKLCLDRFDEEDVAFIGWCSQHRQPCAIGRAGNKWTARQQDGNGFTAYYEVIGKRVRCLYELKSGSTKELMQHYECEDTSAPLSIAKTEDIFNAGKGQRTRKKADVRANRVVVNSRKHGIGMGSVKKRTYCGQEEKCEFTEARKGFRRGERNHAKALARVANAKQARY